MSAAAVDASAVLDFLRRNGLLDAESALRAELAAAEGRMSLGSDYADELPAPPPVRVAVGARGNGSGSVSSSDDDDEEFVSMGSVANSDLVNPYGVWSSSRAESGDSSSDRVSEFGTAREYSDSYWYNEKGGFPSSPWSVDKFVTNIEMEDGNEKPIEALSTRGSGTSAKDISFLGSTDPFFQSSKVSQGDLKHVYASARLDFRESPLCDCCNKVKGSYEAESTSTGIIVGVEDSKLSNMSPYDFSEMMCAEPKSLDYPELTKFQLEFVDNVTEIVSWKQSTMHYSHRGTNSSAKEQVMFPPFPDQELQILDSFADDRISFPAGELSNSTVHMEHASGEDFQENFRIHSEDFEQALPGATGSLENHGEAVEESHNSGNIRDGDEEQGTPTELKVFENIDDEFEIFDLRIIHRKNRTGFEEKKDFPIVLNTIIAGRYYVTEYLGSAAFSKVVQAHDLQTGMDVCLKIIKNDKDFFDQSLDEIKLLKFVNKNDPADEHHILRLYDYFYHQEHLFIVSELLRANLYEFQKFNHESGEELYFTLPRLQRIVRQCLEALEYLHRLGVIHCDLKPENILVKSYSRCEIKVIDLGSSCFQSDNLCLYVQSRSYRAPEVILGLPYDQKIDVWSLGCILAELWSGDVLFPNESLVMMLSRMIGILGPIDLEMLIRGQDTHKYFTCNYDLYHRNEEACELEYIIPEKSSLARHLGVSDAKFLEFLSKLLQTNPLRRPTALEALQHSWFSHQYENIPCSSK